MIPFKKRERVSSVQKRVQPVNLKLIMYDWTSQTFKIQITANIFPEVFPIFISTTPTKKDNLKIFHP